MDDAEPWPCGGKRPWNLRSWWYHGFTLVHLRNQRISTTGESLLADSCDGKRCIVALVPRCGGWVRVGESVPIGEECDAGYERWLEETYPPKFK